MKVKIDTKEKLHVITIHEPDLAANMTEKMDKAITGLLDGNVKNAILNMQDIKMIDNAAATHLIRLQQLFNQHQASFIACRLQPQVKQFLVERGLLGQLSVTPTESEAMDIVQMEEMEREMGL